MQFPFAGPNGGCNLNGITNRSPVGIEQLSINARQRVELRSDLIVIRVLIDHDDSAIGSDSHIRVRLLPMPVGVDHNLGTNRSATEIEWLNKDVKRSTSVPVRSLSA